MLYRLAMRSIQILGESGASPESTGVGPDGFGWVHELQMDWNRQRTN